MAGGEHTHHLEKIRYSVLVQFSDREEAMVHFGAVPGCSNHSDQLYQLSYY